MSLKPEPKKRANSTPDQVPVVEWLREVTILFRKDGTLDRAYAMTHVEEEGSGVRLGATTSLDAVTAAALILRHAGHPGLAEACETHLATERDRADRRHRETLGAAWRG